MNYQVPQKFVASDHHVGADYVAENIAVLAIDIGLSNAFVVADNYAFAGGGAFDDVFVVVGASGVLFPVAAVVLAVQRAGAVATLTALAASIVLVGALSAAVRARTVAAPIAVEAFSRQLRKLC